MSYQVSSSWAALERAGTRLPDRPYLLFMAETGFPHSEVQRMKSSEIALNDSVYRTVSQTPIISPVPDSEPAISRNRYSTLVPRGITGDQKQPDKPKTRPLLTNKPGSTFRQNRVEKKNNPDRVQGPATQGSEDKEIPPFLPKQNVPPSDPLRLIRILFSVTIFFC